MRADLRAWVDEYERAEWTENATSGGLTTAPNMTAGAMTSKRRLNIGNGSPLPAWVRLYEQPENEMALIATSKPSMTFETPPEGVHAGRCYRVIDLGTQTVKEYEGTGTRQVPQVMVSWELLGDQMMADGRPFSIHKTFTKSTHEKAGLRLTLEAWRGRKFTQEEIERFDISKVLGVYGLLNITHTHKNDSTYANIASIMPLPKGMPKPGPVNPNVLFDMDDRDMAVFESLSQNTKLKLQSAAEWNKRTGDAFESDIPWEKQQVETEF